MLTFQQRRENLKRLSNAPRRLREITAVACSQLNLIYGAVEVSHSEAEAFLTPRGGSVSDIQTPVAWTITNNRDLLVQHGA